MKDCVGKKYPATRNKQMLPTTKTGIIINYYSLDSVKWDLSKQKRFEGSLRPKKRKSINCLREDVKIVTINAFICRNAEESSCSTPKLHRMDNEIYKHFK